MLSSVGAEKRRMILRSLVLQNVTGPASVMDHRFVVDVMLCPFTSTSTQLYNNSTLKTGLAISVVSVINIFGPYS